MSVANTRVHADFERLWKLMMPFSRIRVVLEKVGFSIWQWKSCGFLFGEIVKYPKIDIT